MTSTGWGWPDSKIVRVVDGDTVDALVTRDLGFGGAASFTVRLRLNRVNAPAVTNSRGRRAKAWLEPFLAASPTVNITTLKPYKYGGPGDSPGSWMAEIVLADGTNVSDALVAHGAAVYWDGKGPRPDGGEAAA